MANAARQALEEPDMRTGARQLDMPQPLATHTSEGHFHAALVADNAAMLHPLVFAAQALPVRYGTEDAGAEQSIALRLESAVVDSLRLGNFTMRPTADFFRGCQRN